MADTIRTFIAVPIESTPTLAKVAGELRNVGGPVRVVDLDGLHLTLKFLGDTPWHRVSDVGRVVSEVCARHVAIEASLTGIGAFPHPRQARVVWSGLDAVAPLKRLAGELADQLADLGFPAEGRSFVPHVTLARIKGRPPKDLADLIIRHESARLGELHLDRLVYYQSELSRRGPVYTVLSEHELA